MEPKFIGRNQSQKGTAGVQEQPSVQSSLSMYSQE